MVSSNISTRIQAIKEITSLFRLERFVYLTSIVVCLLILLIGVVSSLIKGSMGSAEITSIFGSGGAITIMTGRLLHMWNRAINLLDKSDEN